MIYIPIQFTDNSTLLAVAIAINSLVLLLAIFKVLSAIAEVKSLVLMVLFGNQDKIRQNREVITGEKH